MALLLFDIDGTLLHADAVSRGRIEKALSEVTGVSISTEDVSFAGRTDLAILADVLTTNGLDATSSLVEEALDAYVVASTQAYEADDVDVLPGAPRVLDILHQTDGVHLGLVTGNAEPVAYEKLQAANLDHFFPFGAFGDDHADRNELPPLATERAEAHVGTTFAVHSTAVIGDTIFDVQCGHAAGVRSAAVCTGSHDRSVLAEHQPDLLLDNFRDTTPFFEWIHGLSPSVSPLGRSQESR
jgi:phosphoglycolate phosphatase-like HAD superfamily hydrolase